ncbi:protein LOW PSII ACCUMULATION 2, chloroplastic [Phalaenopsis equestris]|uniref:protein LOW PSII ACCUMULATION 2, chloroplastic n=1 Tax=Phalaenopsis equestris TaxID=78828 RepID=UPI0009E60FED|nr:protein LOW PSII ACCUMULATION 2, chloroplastic [Phalaenopsis equestris]
MESAASLLSIQPQPPSSSLPRSFKRYLSISYSFPSFCFLPLSISSFSSRGHSFLPKAEPSEGLDNPKSTDPSLSTSGLPSPLPPKKPSGSGAGFGSTVNEKKKRKGRGTSSVVRRMPIDKPSIFSPTGDEIRSSQEQQQGDSEGAFLLAWLGLGGFILIEGIALAASGFLPEQWDNFFVKFVYPSFTPTVAVFVGGTVIYGVYKYLQAEKMKG